MSLASLKPLVHRPAVVIAALTLTAVVAFLGVNRLANRFREQQKALARRLYARGLEEQRGGHPDRAIEDFRTALSYSHGEFQYQLSLARALRDTGRTDEAETYLVTLWEQAPQDGAVNLALGRLAAREGNVDKAIQYYHNAIYGVWVSNPDVSRRNARFELAEFLLSKGARPQSEAELITLAAELPADPVLELRAAQLLLRAQDYERALKQYRRVVQHDSGSAAALSGAGEAAFRLQRYPEACGYLRSAVAANPQDTQSRQFLETCNLIVDSDPFQGKLSAAERWHRVRAAFQQAGQRLSCAGNGPGDDDLASLRSQWQQLKPKVEGSADPRTEVEQSVMELVFQIEQKTQPRCGSPVGLDQALLLLGEARNGGER